MKIIDGFLVLSTLFKPKWSYRKLNESKTKWLTIILSSGISLAFWISIFYFSYNGQKFSVWFPIQIFTVFFIFNILIISALFELTTGIIFRKKIDLVKGVSIVSVSSLNYVLGFLIGSIAKTLYNVASEYFIITGILVWGIFISIGVSIIYEFKLGKSSLLVFCIIIPIFLFEGIILNFF